MPRGRHSIGYLVLFSLPFLVQLELAIFHSSDVVMESPGALFGIVLVAASLCALTSGLVLWRAFRTDAAELAWLGLFFLSASLLPLVHGLTTPGVIYGPNDATMVSVLLAVPLGVIAAAPTLASRYGRLAHAWRSWTAAWVVALTLLCLVMLWSPDLMPMLRPRSFAGVVVIGGALLGCALLGHRHVRLAAIADRKAPLVVTAGYSLVAGSAAVLFGSAPYSMGFWVAHVFDIAGVFAATIGGFLVYRRSSSMTDVLAPVVAVEPVAALEVGMHPAVADFVADLEGKDPLTRDHVVRTAELAIEVAAMMRQPPEIQRQAGLVGALHDIGKLEIPGDILNKPGALDDEEWQIMRSHAELGAAIVADCPSLADLAPSVRAHHERIDGTGYPDGLTGDEIPLVAQIVAACDAYDAMAYTRRYRSGMELDEVTEILRRHAGTQWDPLAVQAVTNVVSRRGDWNPTLLAGQTMDRCDCLPEQVREVANASAGV